MSLVCYLTVTPARESRDASQSGLIKQKSLKELLIWPFNCSHIFCHLKSFSEWWPHQRWFLKSSRASLSFKDRAFPSGWDVLFCPRVERRNWMLADWASADQFWWSKVDNYATTDFGRESEIRRSFDDRLPGKQWPGDELLLSIWCLSMRGVATAEPDRDVAGADA